MYRIIDDNGIEIKQYNSPGEILIRGPIVIPGYHNNPEGNQAFDSDGFYHSGDVGYCDAKTKLWYLVDRKKELIKVRGFQVAPPEIEAVLLGHPHIVDTAVIGVEVNEYDGQAPMAFVVRRPGPDGERLTQRQVQDFVLGQLAPYKRLNGGVKFTDAIPRNASGKILKRVLREAARKDRERTAKL